MKFASVVLDVDSTLCGVEGIDWLAQRRGPEMADRVRALTDRAMNGEITLDAVYGERLSMIQPRNDDIEALSRVYRQTIAPGAAEAIRTLLDGRVNVVLVSGGIRQAIAPLARELGVPVHAVELRWDASGEYTGFDATSPLVTQQGKRDVVRKLALPKPVLTVGDGSTDIAMKEVSDRFVAFTGFHRRAQVVQAADGEIGSFAELVTLARGARR